MIRPLLSILTAGLLLGGCATMSPEECQTADWRDVGLRDGLQGLPLSHLDERIGDCAEAGVTVNGALYRQGRQEGLQSYCQPDNATRLGLDGQDYRGVCPASVDAEFRRRHGVAREVHAARKELRDLDTRRDELEKRLREARDDKERSRARDDLYELDRRYRRARDRVRDAEWALDRLR